MKVLSPSRNFAYRGYGCGGGEVESVRSEDESLGSSLYYPVKDGFRVKDLLSNSKQSDHVRKYANLTY